MDVFDKIGIALEHLLGTQNNGTNLATEQVTEIRAAIKACQDSNIADESTIENLKQRVSSVEAVGPGLDTRVAALEKQDQDDAHAIEDHESRISTIEQGLAKVASVTEQAPPEPTPVVVDPAPAPAASPVLDPAAAADPMTAPQAAADAVAVAQMASIQATSAVATSTANQEAAAAGDPAAQAQVDQAMYQHTQAVTAIKAAAEVVNTAADTVANASVDASVPSITEDHATVADAHVDTVTAIVDAIPALPVTATDESTQTG